MLKIKVKVKKKKRKKKPGQAAMEYMLLLAALLLVFLAALGREGFSLRGGIERYVDGLGESVANVIEP